MRYLAVDEYKRLCAQGRIRQCTKDSCLRKATLHGILTITLPEPGGAFVKEECMAVRNPPEIGKPLPAGYVPIAA